MILKPHEVEAIWANQANAPDLAAANKARNTMIKQAFEDRRLLLQDEDNLRRAIYDMMKRLRDNHANIEAGGVEEWVTTQGLRLAIAQALGAILDGQP